MRSASARSTSETRQGAGAASEVRRGRSVSRVVAVLLVVTGLALAWRAAPLADWTRPEHLTGLLAFFREGWHGPIVACALFTAACAALVPVTALIAAAGLALGPVVGGAVALGGSVAAAALGYLAGRRLWGDPRRNPAGGRLDALSRRLARRGLLATVFARIVPVAPFMVVNLVAGASHVRARDFLLGTALGMLPGTILLVVAADRLAAALREPRGPAWLWAALAVGALVGAAAVLHRLRTRTPAA